MRKILTKNPWKCLWMCSKSSASIFLDY